MYQITEYSVNRYIEELEVMIRDKADFNEILNKLLKISKDINNVIEENKALNEDLRDKAEYIKTQQSEIIKLKRILSDILELD